MKIVIHTLEQIAGIEIFPIIGLVIFFAFFLLVGYRVIKAPKEYIDEMSRLPLDDKDDLHGGNNI